MKAKRYQVTLGVAGKAYVITRTATTYSALVSDINRSFGNVVILKAEDLEQTQKHPSFN